MDMAEAPTTTEVRAAAFIDGRWTRGSSVKTFDVRSPVDGTLLARLPEASIEDVDQAVTSALRAFHTVKLTPYERYETLTRAAHMIQEQAEDLARQIVAEAGKPIRDARVEVSRAVQCYLLAGE